ncbi:acyl carrier protein [Actinoplanes teichomyceticus]|uniref:Acyl carrier protein n=1 Tax=Actinoplanes teichomyceticus TaxID=1867 RepID=A0A561WLQ3_ACTTI|nr:phosphopantetheine-binding protein [Actinoplanes teichomyceticus]TWG24791.1 acyl carrier protein [Actinoplanes teichomyceticus]GIF14547.1 acyl carrier protein [Actinoplanes teichomyceticus]
MFDTVKKVLVSRFQVPAEDIEPEASLEDLELDSLDLVELATILESEYGVRITDDEIAEAKQVGAVADLAARKAATV